MSKIFSWYKEKDIVGWKELNLILPEEIKKSIT